jgi:amino acid transporter
VSEQTVSEQHAWDLNGGELDRVISQRMLLVFVLGDILGTGIYALVGEVAAEVGEAIWTAFTLAFALAFITAFAYAELVTKYPQAAGAALYVHKAFEMPFVTFIVTFAVMSSGITSAATAARAFGGDYLSQFFEAPIVVVAIAFVIILAGINFRGISESVKLNSASRSSSSVASWSSSSSESLRWQAATGIRAAPSSSKPARAFQSRSWAARPSPSMRSSDSRTR